MPPRSERGYQVFASSYLNLHKIFSVSTIFQVPVPSPQLQSVSHIQSLYQYPKTEINNEAAATPRLICQNTEAMPFRARTDKNEN